MSAPKINRITQQRTSDMRQKKVIFHTLLLVPQCLFKQGQSFLRLTTSFFIITLAPEDITLTQTNGRPYRAHYHTRITQHLLGTLTVLPGLHIISRIVPGACNLTPEQRLYLDLLLESNWRCKISTMHVQRLLI